MELTKNDNGYKLIIKDDATQNQYEVVLNYLIRKLQLHEVKEINDFDGYYHLFDYKQNKMVLSYSNFLGISFFLFDKTISIDIQENILSEISEILSEVPL